jgi:hypothetical protein
VYCKRDATKGKVLMDKTLPLFDPISSATSVRNPSLAKTIIFRLKNVVWVASGTPLLRLYLNAVRTTDVRAGCSRYNLLSRFALAPICSMEAVSLF